MNIEPPTHLWSVPSRPTPLAGGARASVFRTDGLNQDLVFKTTTRTAEALQWLAPVKVAARAAGFVVPKSHPSRSGMLLEQGWTCETYIDGRPFELSEMADIAPMLKRFHKAAIALPQRPGFLSSQDLVMKSSGGDIDFAAMPAPLVADIRAAFHALDPAPLTIVHGDLTPANLLRLPDGGIALLDWDEARRDLPLFDLQVLGSETRTEARACLAWEVACCWNTEPSRARKLAKRL